MSDKDVTIEELEETAKQTDAQMDLLEWKMDNKELVQPISGQEVCVMNLLQSVSEKAELASARPARLTEFLAQVRSDYQQLRRELVEVQELQRELSSRLRAQLRLVHGKFARLRQRIAAVPPPR